VGSPTVVSHPSCWLWGAGGVGVAILGGGGGGASCGIGNRETRVSLFSCSSILIVRGLARLLLVELLLCDVCIFEIVVGIQDFVVLWRITGRLDSAL